ncbi:hypothetical protein [Polaribacter sp. Hel_I_88]|uniref:hypothetical protein n=1 Tax=Polaribacter sp. Hel_I_88 TaxID=1250006 RepID=UPI00047C86B6|nr:hypothetical protein [Polaribacter sp. Hel_I_88]
MKKTITILAIGFVILSSCVQKEYEKKVTFIVDTNGVVEIKSLGIKGDFLPNQWQESYALKDSNNDGIYEVTFTEKTAVAGINFKFVKNGFDYELKDKENREIIFEYKPEVITYKTKFNNPTSEIIKK